jgi:1,4-alpha-glucan branching enzyme
VARTSYCFGVPYEGEYTEVLNCTSPDGSPVTNGTVHSKPVPMHGLEHSICIDIPAYGCLYFTVKKDKPKPKKRTTKKTAAASEKTEKTEKTVKSTKTAKSAKSTKSAKSAKSAKTSETAEKSAKTSKTKKSAAKKADD